MSSDTTTLANPVTFDAILQNARELKGYLRSESDEIEQTGCLTPDVLSRLIDAGVFRMSMPSDWGGPSLSSLEQLKPIEALSEANASVAWSVMRGSDAGLYAGFLDDQIARDLYPHLDMVQSGSIIPAGIAEEVEGGFKVSGEWRYCSGAKYADMIGVACRVLRNSHPVLDAEGIPESRMVLAPSAHWKLLEGNSMTGLRGTASHSLTTVSEYLVIPREHTFSIAYPQRQGPLYAGPDATLLKMAGVPLGTARGMLD
ncbi:MAG TPA: hypothetical protein DCM54_12975 [Gammaproteobacteria bacterium]|nr:hypothetical protein [Gammaproteobacteria bacterium]